MAAAAAEAVWRRRKQLVINAETPRGSRGNRSFKNAPHNSTSPTHGQYWGLNRHMLGVGSFVQQATVSHCRGHLLRWHYRSVAVQEEDVPGSCKWKRKLGVLFMQILPISSSRSRIMGMGSCFRSRCLAMLIKVGGIPKVPSGYGNITLSSVSYLLIAICQIN